MPNSYPVAVPPSTPVVVYFDPNKTDRGLVEYVNTSQEYYQALDLGVTHPNTRDYPGFRLGIQQAVDGNEKWIKRVWVTDSTNEDWFNYELKFAAEANAFPTFIRQYREDRKTYAPKTKLLPLTAVYKIVLTADGSGYVPGTLPTLTFSGGSGTGAAGHAIVNPDGTLADLVLDDGGTGYTSAPTIVVEAPPSGTTATGTAYIQPTSAILIAEHAEKFPQDSEFFGLYLNVTRVYETIPGPTLATTKLDEKDGVVTTVYTTRGLCSAITTGENITTGIWTKTVANQTEIQGICDQVITARAIPGFPMVSTKVDEDGKIITQTQTYVDSTTIVNSETIVGGVWIRKFEEDVDGTTLVSWQMDVRRAVPGNPVPSTTIDDDGQVVYGVETLKDEGLITSGETLATGTWTRTMKKDVSDLVSKEVVERRTIPGPIQEGEETDKWGLNLVFKQKVALLTTSPDEGYLVKQSKVEPFQGSDLVGTKITVNYPVGLYGVALPGQDYDPRLNTVIPYVQKLQPISYGIGVNFEDITPEDYKHANVRTIDPTTVAAVLDEYVFSYPGRINVDMPDLLTAVTAVIESSTSDGADQEVGSNTLVGSGSVAQTLTAQSQASANILPEAWPTIKQFWGNNIACQHYHFFLPSPAVISDVLTKLEAIIPGSISNWPKYNPELVTIVMTGGRVSVQAKAHSQGSYATSGSGTASTAAGGTGYSEERGLTIKTLRISPTIHDTIYVYGIGTVHYGPGYPYGYGLANESVTASAYAEAAGLGPLETQSTGPLSVDTIVSPAVVQATKGGTTWPTSGLFLYRTDPHPYRYGYIEFHCVVVDAADFPNV